MNYVTEHNSPKNSLINIEFLIHKESKLKNIFQKHLGRLHSPFCLYAQLTRSIRLLGGNRSSDSSYQLGFPIS